jgi:hypothetical protein
MCSKLAFAFLAFFLGSIKLSLAADCTDSITKDNPAPFAELVKCVAALENSVGKITPLPTDTIAFFFLDKCPDNWTDEPRLAGRYAVGLMSGGELGKEVGTKLDPSEDRAAGAHVHKHNTVVMADRYPPAGANVQFRNPGGGLQPQGGWVTDAGTDLKPGTNAPYVLLRACRKI